MYDEWTPVVAVTSQMLQHNVGEIPCDCLQQVGDVVQNILFVFS